MRRAAAAWAIAVLLGTAATAPSPAAEEPRGGPRVAATANGQSIAILDDTRRVIRAFEASRPDSRRDLVGPAAADAAEFVAVGYLTGDVVAAVCRAGAEWSLCTYRTAPDGPVDAGSPLQRVVIGVASGDPDRIDLAVSHARGWLAITGLPAPLPPVLRAAVAGVRVGPLAARGCPDLGAATLAVAATVSPADELVLVVRGAAQPGATRPDGDEEIAFFDLAGRELLRLPTGLREIRGLEFGREDQALWAAGADARGRSGVWRLDAALADGRQVIRPVLMAAFDSPRDLVCSSPRAMVLVHGAAEDRVAVIDPADLVPPQNPGAAP